MKTEKYLTVEEQMKLQLLRDDIETMSATIDRFIKKRESLREEVKQIQNQIKNGNNTN